jgi:hypothetical protein
MTASQRPLLVRSSILALRIVLGFFWILLVAWGALALWFDGPASRQVAGVLIAGLVVAGFGLPLALGRRGMVAAVVVWAVLYAWWSGLAPRNDRDWIADVKELPAAIIEGDRVTIANVRNFDYRSETDYTPHWETRTYDLAQIEGLDLFLSYWGSPWIAHTIMSWEFADGRHLAISIETRKEQGESYSAVRGFFRQYELYYVVADERDLARLRTNYRGEDVYLYRLAVSPARAKALLLAYLGQVNQLKQQPVWYNAFTHNCTTSIRLNVQHIGIQNPWNWRILANGYIDELLYWRHTISRELPFAEIRERSNITARAKAADADPAFSARIREGLPSRPRDPFEVARAFPAYDTR